MDILPVCVGYKATLCMSVMDLENDRWPEGYFDVIWASCPCTEWSRAKSTGTRDTEGASALVKKTLALIRALKPKYYFLENPASGNLKHEEYMAGIPYADVSYCRYTIATATDWGYRKNTRIWTNALDVWKPRPLCAKDCLNMGLNERGRWVHLRSAQKGPSRGAAQDICFSTFQLYRLPPDLILEILRAVS